MLLCFGQVTIKDSNIGFCLILLLLIARASWPTTASQALQGVLSHPPGSTRTGDSRWLPPCPPVSVVASARNPHPTGAQARTLLLLELSPNGESAENARSGFPTDCREGWFSKSGQYSGQEPNADLGSSYPLSTHWVQDDDNSMKEASIQEET